MSDSGYPASAERWRNDPRWYHLYSMPCVVCRAPQSERGEGGITHIGDTPELDAYTCSQACRVVRSTQRLLAETDALIAQHEADAALHDLPGMNLSLASLKAHREHIAEQLDLDRAKLP